MEKMSKKTDSGLLPSEECPYCGHKHTGIIDTDRKSEWKNRFTEFLADRIIRAIEKNQPNFGNPKLNKIVKLAMKRADSHLVDPRSL